MLSIVGAFLWTGAAQPQSLSKLAQANDAWMRCVAAVQPYVKDERKGSGARSQIDASRSMCKVRISQVRAEIAADLGSAADQKLIDTAFENNLNDVVVAYEQRLESQPRALGLECKASYKKGLSAYQKGDYQTALCFWLPKAREGHSLSQNNMGFLFENGLTADTPKSDAQAAEWYVLAAKQGELIAMHNLARVQRRLGYLQAAESWERQAASAENQKAQSRAVLAGAVGYAIGCAVGGGCSDEPVYETARTVVPVGREKTPKSIPSDTIQARVGYKMCPDGSYVSGDSCRLAPDGTYVGGRPVMTPDGSYAGDSYKLAPNGSYVGGSGNLKMCPDGSYVRGERCVMTPTGTYVGG